MSKITSKAENDNSFSFLELKLPIITNNTKHLFTENQISVEYLRTMKVTWIKDIRSH